MKASQLFAMGYEDLLPLRGKAPVPTDWPNFQADITHVAEWDKNPRNLGLLTERFPAIDCDIIDVVAADAVLIALREVFGNQIPVRVGKAPKWLAVFRRADPIKKMKITLVSPAGENHHIEILGKGQQFVIAGIHPDTNAPYEWSSALIPAHLLPELTDDKIEEFLFAVEEKLSGIGWKIGTRSSGGGGTDRTPVAAEQLWAPTVDFLQAAVATIYNGPDVSRDIYVKIGHAIKGATREEQDELGWEVFNEWASRYPNADIERDRLFWDGINREAVVIGWGVLRTIAEKSGWDGEPAAVAQAQEEFTPVAEAPASYEFPITLGSADDHTALAQYIEDQEHEFFTTGDNNWFIWDTRRWEPDPGKDANLTKGRIAMRLQIVADMMVEKYQGGKKVALAVNKLHSVSLINNVFTRLSMSSRIYRSRESVNDAIKHTYTLNTPSGTWDLRNLTERKHDPADFITQVTRVAPDFQADCPEFKKFLYTSCGGDKQLVAYVLAVLGSALTADVQDRYIWFLTGESGAGKSTLMKHMHAILGDYAGIVPQGALIHGEQVAHQSAVAGFRDRRFLHGSEIDRGHKWNVALLKAITGNEVITARRLYHDFEEFTIVGKVIIAGNETPTLTNVDSAIRRRLRVIKFTAPDESDPHLDAKLRAEYPAILAFIMSHASVWIDKGYPHSEAVSKLTEEYFREEDLIGQFRDHHYLVMADNPNAFAPYSELLFQWEQFTTLAQRREHGILTIKSLSRALQTSDKRLFVEVRKVEGKSARGLAGLMPRENLPEPVTLEDLM